MTSKIKTAIIGYGRSGQFLHGKGLRENHRNFEIIAVSSVSKRSLDQASKDFGCPTYTNYQTMLDEHNLDLVVIVTRNDQHCQMACDALEAGANVVVTKPLGVNAQQVTRIYETALHHQRKVYPYLPARWGTDFIRLKEIIGSGEIGDIFAIHRSVYGFATRNDWQTRRQYGGGILLNWGAHLIDPPLLLTGGKPNSLFGSYSQLLNPGDAEDNFYSIITTDNGIRVHSQWSFSPKGMANWFIQGTSGCIIADGNDLRIYTGKPAHPDDPTIARDMEGNNSSCREETVGEDIYGNPTQIYHDLALDMHGEKNYPVSKREATQLAILLDSIRISQENQQLVKF